MKHYCLELIKKNPYLSMEQKSFWIDAVYNPPKGLHFRPEHKLREALDLSPEQSFKSISSIKVFEAWAIRDLWKSSSTTDENYNAVISALEKVRKDKSLKAFRLILLGLITLTIAGYLIFK